MGKIGGISGILLGNCGEMRTPARTFFDHCLIEKGDFRESRLIGPNFKGRAISQRQGNFGRRCIAFWVDLPVLSDLSGIRSLF